MSRSKGLLTGLTASLILMGTSASAVTLAEYNFDSNTGAPSSPAPGITAGTANFSTWSSGVTSPGFNFGQAFAATNATENTGDPIVQDLGEALTNNNYLSFTLNGTGFSVENISYAHSVSGAINGATYASYLFVSKTSAPDFSEGQQLTALTPTPGDPDNTPTTSLTNTSTSATVNFDTSGIAALQGLSEEIEVRIYLSDDTFDAGQFHSLDSISVSGVPEPTSLAVLGILGVFVLSRRRRTA